RHELRLLGRRRLPPAFERRRQELLPDSDRGSRTDRAGRHGAIQAVAKGRRRALGLTEPVPPRRPLPDADGRRVRPPPNRAKNRSMLGAEAEPRHVTLPPAREREWLLEQTAKLLAAGGWGSYVRAPLLQPTP